MTNVLIVCMGNICRSPMAEAVLKQIAGSMGLSGQVSFDSAGTHATVGRIDARAKSALERRNIPVTNRRARRISERDFVRFDHILAMDKDNLATLVQLCPPESRTKLSLFLNFAEGRSGQDVPDPYYGSVDGFERVLNLCQIGAYGLLRAIRSSETTPPR